MTANATLEKDGDEHYVSISIPEGVFVAADGNRVYRGDVESWLTVYEARELALQLIGLVNL